MKAAVRHNSSAIINILKTFDEARVKIYTVNVIQYLEISLFSFSNLSRTLGSVSIGICENHESLKGSCDCISRLVQKTFMVIRFN